MLFNYLIVALRNLLRSRVYAFINVASGLLRECEVARGIRLPDCTGRRFVIGGGLAFVIAVSTVAYLGLRAARMNPVDAMRYE